MGTPLWSPTLDIVSSVLGWLYTIAWSLSFYPQVWQNWRRASVVGLSFDFLAMNILGFAAYSVYNCALFFNVEVQTEYIEKHGPPIPVQVNDVVFAVHAVVLTLIQIGQCLFYDRGGQLVNVFVQIAVTAGWLSMYVLALIVGGSNESVVNWLFFINFCSYIKLLVTLAKYVPQVWAHYLLKSTVGWHIGNNLLDLVGAFLSFAQQFVDGVNGGNLTGVFLGDPVKLGLSLLSIFFDAIFIFQHYVLYTDRADPHRRRKGAIKIVGITLAGDSDNSDSDGREKLADYGNDPLLSGASEHDSDYFSPFVINQSK
jgi:cystinosin